MKKNNDFCSLDELNNEADVEAYFTLPLLTKGLGYTNKQIRNKAGLEELKVSVGRKKVNYRPDYAAIPGKDVCWVCDAKHPSEDLDKWIGQCSSYCLELNSRYPSGQNPVEYFILTNGVTTRLYKWDSDDPVLELKFTDFVSSNKKYQRFQNLLLVSNFKKIAKKPTTTTALIIKKKTPNDLNADFAWCHDKIHKKDALSYTAAFMEFVKLIFLKLLSDKALHNKYPEFGKGGKDSLRIEHPDKEVPFSLARILSSEAMGVENPIGLQFENLRTELEGQIKRRRKKRIFSENEPLRLSTQLIKDIVKRLEGTDLYGLDADLNGRLFETFLNATLRGKALGQYFTPRSVVKLLVGLADLQVKSKLDDCDIVIDACCGSGGFLIEALADMWRKVDGIKSLNTSNKELLRDNIATNCLYGIDSAKDPALARIARMNMYLHGDGGSSIYQMDALDKLLAGEDSDGLEVKAEREDFAKHLAKHPDGFATVALTNPPFAREYERPKIGKKDPTPEASILDEYDLSYDLRGGGRKPKEKLKSSLMFLERYLDYLQPEGRLITVIDDSVLGSRAYLEARKWLMKKYIVEAVISLPGDAFQRSEARVKTSVLVLRKKTEETEEQASVFMYFCTKVGVDDPSRERVLPIDESNHKAALEEISRVSDLFKKFRSLPSDPSLKKWVVSLPVTASRWDVKACLLKSGRLIGKWKKQKLTIKKFDSLVSACFVDGKPLPGYESRVIKTKESPIQTITHLRITYKGMAERGEEKYSSDADTDILFKVAPGDLVISHINAIHGAIAIVPDDMKDLVVTNEYSVLKCGTAIDSRIVWGLLRSSVIRADILLKAQGIGRTRTSWGDLKALELPLPDPTSTLKMIALFNSAEEFDKKARAAFEQQEKELKAACLLTDAEAEHILSAFKPPQ